MAKPGSFLLLAIPTPRHLYGMKEILYEKPYENEYREDDISRLFACAPGSGDGEITVNSPEHIEALFSMTPYYWKTPREGAERLRRLSSLHTEIGFDFLLYRREDRP